MGADATYHTAILHAKLFSALVSMVYFSSVNAAADSARAEGACVQMGCFWRLGCKSGRLRRRRKSCLRGRVVLWHCGCVWAAGPGALRGD